MDFFKKIFGKFSKKGGDEETFVCDTCGEERSESQRKESATVKEQSEAHPNTCEFC
ncbi:MAG: hypothetical protein AAB727_00085 [Patescibacteria group bacterium]